MEQIDSHTDEVWMPEPTGEAVGQIQGAMIFGCGISNVFYSNFILYLYNAANEKLNLLYMFEPSVTSLVPTLVPRHSNHNST